MAKDRRFHFERCLVKACPIEAVRDSSRDPGHPRIPFLHGLDKSLLFPVLPVAWLSPSPWAEACAAVARPRGPQRLPGIPQAGDPGLHRAHDGH